MRLKIISLILALCAWGYLRFVANPLLPHDADRHAVLVISVTGLRPGTNVRLDESKVSVEFDASVDSVTLAAGTIGANVDLSQVPPGRHVVPVIVHSSSVSITDLHPATVVAVISQGS